MPRPKKPEERARIRDVAFNIFASRGFDGASFSNIAKEAAVSKSLVQYYFPKKEMFLEEFIVRSLNVLDDIVSEDFELPVENELGRLFAVSVLQFHVAMYDDKLRMLRMDVLRDRGFTEIMRKYAIDWIIRNTKFLPEGDEGAENTFIKNLVFVIGGTFDYLYDCLLYDAPYDGNFLTANAAKILSPLGMVDEEEANLIRDSFTEEWLAEARRKYDRALFGTA